ncbi:MAG: bifunctional phosphoribosylaminoimidazolecarboxamide formyltransferase/IMP cyclohydrolase [Crenarchaeota archaeon]|nr:bifunctional phosphoribosylaminoimidazolecarboxamide formyltransferase/IMP cyclohydrolase [Thermoproteota archaeon]MDW8033745.1 bifunctional phosphoribosylaminoimidazolecarboxamide formyltransferase/IMP cyclohydrolase [Nitrososphaerota archaeon]
MKEKVALLSVSNLKGLEDFAKGLLNLGFKLYATDSTLRKLVEAGVKANAVSEITGFRSILGGRVKTLHPLIYAGILASRSNASHIEEVKKLNATLFDMVVVNPYPLPDESMSLEDFVERIDIGGITLLRAAVKNFTDVIVVCDPDDYGKILAEFYSKGDVSNETRRILAVKAMKMVAEYEQEIARLLSKVLLGKDLLYLNYEHVEQLKYGENWHQTASLYAERGFEMLSLARARRPFNRQMSFNNFLDAEAAVWAVADLMEYGFSSVVVKHRSICAAATGPTLLESLKVAWNSDPVSAYGSVLGFSYNVNEDVAKFISKRFVEVVVAPSFSSEALKILERNKNLRLIEIGDLKKISKKDYRFISGGVLIQDRDIGYIKASEFKPVTKMVFPVDKLELARFACLAVKHVMSNAIVIAREYADGFYHTIGIGGGQPNRVDAIVKLAIPRALEYCKRNGLKPEEVLKECVLASEAFFPFPDSIEAIADAGLRYVVQPGGSKRDDEVIETADKRGVAMLFTGRRCFKH